MRESKLKDPESKFPAQFLIETLFEEIKLVITEETGIKRHVGSVLLALSQFLDNQCPAARNQNDRFFAVFHSLKDSNCDLKNPACT